MVSGLVRIEVRVRPIRENNRDLLDRYDAFLDTEPLIVARIDDAVLERATQLRARHRFKTPDAIHLATAIEHRADVFLTGDRQLQRCPGVRVEVVEAGEATA